MPSETRTERREWWNVEWTPRCTTVGYDSPEQAREAKRGSVWPNARITRITQITVTTEEPIDA